MLKTFRAKLMLLVVATLITLVAVVAGGMWLGIEQSRDLDDIERTLIPQLELGPQMEAGFDKLVRSIEGAVAAQDDEALKDTEATKAQLLRLLATRGGPLSAAERKTLEGAIQDYYAMARGIAARLIAGDGSESLVEQMSLMQVKQANTAALIRRLTTVDRRELAAGFSVVRDGHRRADRYRLAIGLCGFLFAFGLATWVYRGLLPALSALSSGFSRFATGDFSRPIPLVSHDEIGNLAREANQMAESLRRLGEQRDRHDWIKAGQAGLADELKGELEPRVVADRTLKFLAQHMQALAGAFYVTKDDVTLTLLGQYAHAACPRHDALSAAHSAVPGFRVGEGLVGQAAVTDELFVIDDPPGDYLKIRSGLGETVPRTLILAPIFHGGKPLAVIELALLVSCSEDTRELLGSVRRTLGIVLEAAKSRAAERELLERTMRQAERLTVQEEELRLNNQELQAQQEQLQRANDELEAQRAALSEQNRELESAREHLQQQANELGTVSTYKSQFLSNMSHELRTPLNSMLLLSHLLADNEAGNLAPKQVEHCRTIHAAGRDLLALINQVLDLSKIEAGKQEIDLEEADLSGFAEHARRNFGPMAADKGLELVIEIAPNLPHAIITDRQRTERILTNLIGNALKFTEHGEVRLSISRPDSRTTLQRPDLRPETTIAFAVSDTGIGIPVEAQERAFAPFEQLDAKPDRRYAGTGLGLTIARESATLLGGELQLQSTPGRGSTFTCYLPERLGPLKPTAQPPKANGKALLKAASNGEPKQPSSPPGEETHVLVIEDDPILAEQLVEIIRARQLKVLVASTGEYGLRLAVEHRPRGILLDVKLPDIDGWTVIERLRRHPNTRSIPVHFISGVDAPERGLALGAVGYLLKPANHAELSRAVHAVTRGASNSQRILVVEDDKVEGESLLALLRKQDVPASHVSTAAAALNALESETFGCVILDLGLPDLDGLSLLETLRARGGTGAPRVIVHTARSLTKQESRRLEAYAEAIVLKDGSSRERLLDEILLFVRHVRDSLPADERLPKSTPARSDVSLDGARILLAEDDMRTVYALSALLKGKGAEVLVADTGREALDVLAAHPEIQCLLLDLMMPEMDGYEAMRLLRKDARFANLPVIVLTAKAMKGERERCLDAGASDYLTKPIDTDQLLSKLQTWISPN